MQAGRFTVVPELLLVIDAQLSYGVDEILLGVLVGGDGPGESARPADVVEGPGDRGVVLETDEAARGGHGRHETVQGTMLHQGRLGLGEAGAVVGEMAGTETQARDGTTIIETPPLMRVGLVVGVHGFDVIHEIHGGGVVIGG